MTSARPLLLLTLLLAPGARAEEAPAEPAPPAPPRVEKLSESCYAVLQGEGRSNAGFVVGSRQVLVIDCLGSKLQAGRLLAAVREVTDLPVEYLVLTHWHYDQVLGNDVFPDETNILAANGSATLLKERLARDRGMLGGAPGHRGLGFFEAREADLVVEESTEYDLGDCRVYVQVVGSCHTAGDLTVYVPDEKVLFAGDLAWNGMHPNIGGGSTFTWIAALAQLERLDIERVVPGHGDVGDKALLRDQRHYLMTLRRLVKHLAKQEVPLEDILTQLPVPEEYAEYGYEAWWPGNLRFIHAELLRGH